MSYQGSVGAIVADKADDVGYHAEKRIRIDEERISFPVSQSDSSPRFPQRSVTYGLLRF